MQRIPDAKVWVAFKRCAYLIREASWFERSVCCLDAILFDNTSDRNVHLSVLNPIDLRVGKFQGKERDAATGEDCLIVSLPPRPAVGMTAMAMNRPFTTNDIPNSRNHTGCVRKARPTSICASLNASQLYTVRCHLLS